MISLPRGEAENFRPAQKFQGYMQSAVFKLGPEGLGYYKDAVAPPNAKLLAKLDLEDACVVALVHIRRALVSRAALVDYNLNHLKEMIKVL